MGGVLTLCGLALMLTFTIVVRKLFSWQVNGDNEIVRMFAAFSITALFPWCQLTGSNIVVDLLTSGLPARKNRILDQIGSLLLGAVLLVLTWRTGLLVLESRASGAFSPLLAWPVWMFQALMLPGLLLTAINGFYLGLSPRAMTLRTEFFLLSEEVE
ncbi:TRAP transporter small permease [Paracoccus sp. N5]|uniref:TRAP transporter small permease n=1 Tax=Paracoccus sp. N5 TaxID=1101189 RepID=UPI0018DEEE1A|nr:TRAP transporter small permease [Paracoccus sp. N5]